MTLESWSEPRAFAKIMHIEAIRHSSKWFRPIAAAVTSIGMIGLWWIAHFNPQKTPPPLWVAVILATFMGWFTAYGIPLLFLLFPAKIKITETKIIKIWGNTARHILAKSAIGYSFEIIHGFHALRVVVDKEKDLVVGLPSCEIIPQIEKALSEIKIPRSRIGPP